MCPLGPPLPCLLTAAFTLFSKSFSNLCSSEGSALPGPCWEEVTRGRLLVNIICESKDGAGQSQVSPHLPILFCNRLG